MELLRIRTTKRLFFIRAAYVEGKLGFETSASMYHKSSLDEYFFDYYKRNKLSEII